MHTRLKEIKTFYHTVKCITLCSDQLLVCINILLYDITYVKGYHEYLTKQIKIQNVLKITYILVEFCICIWSFLHE